MSRIIEDLIPNILLCLPVKALLRFRCLSKALCYEIHSEAFIKAYLNRSIQTRTRRKLVFLDEYDDFYAIDFVGELTAPTKLCSTPSVYKEEGQHNSKKRTPYHHGSCNGLLLISSFDETFVEYELWLWNPFTRKSNKLPDCPRLCDLPVFGFGYDPLSNDHKVVMIQEDPEHVEGPEQHQAGTSVFSMRSNTWRKLPLSIPLEIFHEMLSDAVFVDGALHWLSHISATETVEIVSFDISEEKFVHLIHPPHSDSFPSEFDISLAVLEGCLVYCQKDPISQQVELSYAVKNGQQQIAWRKLYKLHLPCSGWDFDFKILEESSDGSMILLQTIIEFDAYANFFWYDLKQRTLERVNNIRQVPLDLISHADFLNFQRASFCWESLVSPDFHDKDLKYLTGRRRRRSWCSWQCCLCLVCCLLFCILISVFLFYVI